MDKKKPSAATSSQLEQLKMLEEIQRATLNILEDFDQEKSRFRELQHAMMNLLEDFYDERQKYKDFQKATLNLLEDMNAERLKYQMIQKAAMNLVEDMNEERQKSDDVKRALINILDDIETERVQSEKSKALLESVNKELEAFSYSVSHDLRAPLRALSGFSEAIIEDYTPVLGDRGKRYLGYIKDNAHIMGQLIDDLLSFSRLGRQPMTAMEIDMVSLAQEVFRELMVLTPDRKIEFSALQTPLVMGDRSLIKQVLVNLLSNAIKFTRPRDIARIEFGFQGDADSGAFYVQDNGVGFDMHYADKLFGVFQRLHSTSEFEGTGVGLALVKRIVVRHGGSIWAQSQLDQGTTFYFTLPLRKE